MERTRSILRWTAILCTVAAILICTVAAEGLKAPLKQPSGEANADNVLITSLAQFGELDKPPVLFPHDLHTEALSKEKKDCFSCHLKESIPPSTSTEPALQSQAGERMSIKFKRLKDSTAKEVRRIYHDNCIGCHRTMAEKGEEHGPVVCGECHKGGTMDRSARVPMGLDNSLHYRHSKAAKDHCDLCHHGYDEKTKKLFYAKGKEETCRYCHQSKTEENRISMAMASHLSCVECHRVGKEKSLESGPITCNGCHEAKAQQKIKRVEPIPRMKRNQPDFVFVKTQRKGEQGEVTRMNPVPFDHKAHEGYNDTCRVCHHASMTACSECHGFSKPLKEGNYVQLERAMHQSGSERSCTGCHDLKQQTKECAGCHVFIPQGQEAQSESCLKCHMKPFPDAKALPLTADAQEELAKRLLQSRQVVKGTYPAEEIPDEVTIKYLVNTYEPVTFPHRKIVSGLLEKTHGSKQTGKLAAYFHHDHATVCQGCHHNSPGSAKPPSCFTCHGRPFDGDNLLKPGIIGAYHQQCMGCHEAMDLKKPKECVDCHKERKK